MYSSKCNFVLLAALLTLSGSCLAQTMPQDCANAPALSWNNTALAGAWYEVGRNPMNSSIGCVEINPVFGANSTLQINATYSVQPKSWYMNMTEMANVTLVQGGQQGGYNLTFVNPMNNASQWRFYKLLNYNATQNFVAGCAYTNATDNSTSFGFILSQVRFVNTTVLNMYNNYLAANFSNFINGSIAAVPQSDQCYQSGAITRSLPLFTTLMAIVYMLLKLTN